MVDIRHMSCTRWRRVVVTVGAAIVTLTVLVAGVVCLPKSAPAPLEAAVLAAEERVQARNRGRQPAWGEMVEGAAFEHYAAALRRQSGSAVLSQHHEQVATDGCVLTTDQRQVQRAASAPVLDSLCRGAHCCDAEPQPLRDGSLMVLAWLGDEEVRLLLTETRWHPAVQLWLDVATFLLDVDEIAWLPNHCEVWTDATSAPLPRAAAAELAAGIERLELRVQRPSDPMASMAPDIRAYLDGTYGISEWPWSEVLAAAEWGFDPNARHLEAFAELMPALARLEPPEVTDAARKAQWQSVADVARTMGSGLVPVAVEGAYGDECTQRQLFLRLRQLRLVLARP
jgi:hypothetical protein